jgi:[ribosomal protein S5]-alanine N-acetyltransferase
MTPQENTHLHLKSPRMVLQPATAADLDWLHGHWTDPAVRRYLWDDVVIPRRTVEELMVWSAAAFQADGWGIWLCKDIETHANVGFTALRPVPDGGPLEILYGISPEWWRQGRAPEAALAVLGYGFEVLERPVILGDTDTPNVASAKVMEKIGMIPEGEIVRDGLPTLRFRMTRAEWEQRKGLQGDPAIVPER